MTRSRTAAASLLLAAPILLATEYASADDVQPRVPGPVLQTSIVPDSPGTAVPGDAPDGDIERLLDLYREAQLSSMLEEADTLAKRIVDMSIRVHGIDSKTTAVALTNLANLQSSSEDNASAVLNYEQAIEIVERVDSRLSSDLISPLRGMGYAHLQAGNANLASAAWSRALHVSHVNFGPHNFEQVETLYAIGRLLRSAGEYKRAARIYQRISLLRVRAATAGAVGELDD